MAKVIKHYGECAEKGNAFSAHGFYKPEALKREVLIIVMENCKVMILKLPGCLNYACHTCLKRNCDIWVLLCMKNGLQKRRDKQRDN